MNTGIWIMFFTSYDSCFYVLALNEMSCWKVWNKVLLPLYNLNYTFYPARFSFLENTLTSLEIFLLEKQQQQQNKASLSYVIPLLQYLVKCKKLKVYLFFLSLSHDSSRAVRPPPWIHYVVQYPDMCRHVECKWRETFSEYCSQASNNARLAVGLSQNTSGQRLFRDR